MWRYVPHNYQRINILACTSRLDETQIEISATKNDKLVVAALRIADCF